MRSCHFHGLSGERPLDFSGTELMLLGWHACLIALRHVINELFIAKVGQFPRRRPPPGTEYNVVRTLRHIDTGLVSIDSELMSRVTRRGCNSLS